jgi:membrane fusion protein, adhesin transport system
MSSATAKPPSAAELPYLQHVQAAWAQEQHRFARWTVLLLLALVGAAVAWAHLSMLEIVTVGVGKVVPMHREQVIQSLDPGVLSEIRVKEGDRVTKDQILLRIDDTRAGASYNEGAARALSLVAQVARLRAEVTGAASPNFPASVKGKPAIISAEMALFVAKRKSVEDSVAELKTAVGLIEQELAMTEPLAAKGMVSEVDVLRLRRQVSDLRMQSAERWNKYRAEANGELTKAESELAQVTSNVSGRQDALKRTVVRAPMSGTIKNIRVNTLGGVVQVGQDIMSIVPGDDGVMVEAKIRPADVAFVRVGMPATIKLSAYDFSLYGGLKGVVQLISPDTMDEDRKAGPPQEAYYRVLVKTDTTTLEHKGEKLAIMPGMVATAELLTGERTVLQYLMKPVLRGQEALRER